MAELVNTKTGLGACFKLLVSRIFSSHFGSLGEHDIRDIKRDYHVPVEYILIALAIGKTTGYTWCAWLDLSQVLACWLGSRSRLLRLCSVRPSNPGLPKKLLIRLTSTQQFLVCLTGFEPATSSFASSRLSPLTVDRTKCYLVRPRGLEPLASGFASQRSIQLSYERISRSTISSLLSSAPIH